MASLLFATLSFPITSIIDLSSPLSEITPIHIGCIPTHVNDTLADLVYAASTLGSSADIVLFPETALVLPEDELARKEVIDNFMWDVTRQYGNRVIVVLESGEEGERKNEAVLIDRLGEVASYEKRRLVPFVEYRFERGEAISPVWTIDLATPKGVNKTTWSPDLPRVRQVAVIPMICLDSLHPGLLSSTPTPPDLVVISASAPMSLSDQIILHAQQISSSHGIPSFICSSQGGLSGYIDAWGRVLHLQKGGKALVVEIAIPHGSGGRRRTGWETLGKKGVLGLAWAVVAVLKGWQADVGKIRHSVTEQIQPIVDGFRKLIGWKPEEFTPLIDRNPPHDGSPLQRHRTLHEEVNRAFCEPHPPMVVLVVHDRTA